MKIMKTWRFILVTCLSVLAFQTGSAQYAEDVLRFSQYGLGVGARTQGMGNAAVGSVDDYTALFWNPAGLALQRNYEFSAGLSQNGYGNDVDFLGLTTNSKKNQTTLNNIGFVYPIATTRGSLTFGFGFGRVANYNATAFFSGFNSTSSIVQSLLGDGTASALFLTDTLNVPVDTGHVQQTGTVLEGGGLNHWTFGGAVDVAKDLSVGASLNFVSGSYTFDRVFTEEDVQNYYTKPAPYDFSKFRYENTFTSDLSGFNVLFGFMLKKQGRYKIGASIRTPTNFEITENFSDIGTSSFKNGDVIHKEWPGETKYKVTTPWVFSGGVSVQLLDWLVLAGDAEYTDWTEMQFDSDNPDLIDENTRIMRIYRATTNLRGGAELSLWSLGLKLRGGLVYNPSPYKGDPTSRDQVYYTGGIGVDVDNNTTINASYAIGTWNTFQDNYIYYIGFNKNVSGTSNEKVTINTINVSLSYRF
jgi:long-subunit fatty acid transport protein